jgi:diguanylate cyclase (GGDEF)-like protein
MEFIAQISKIAGKALESAILYESSIHRVSDLKLINKATHKLNSYLRLSELVQILKNEIVSICKPSEIGFVYFDETTQEDYTIFEESTSYFNTDDGRLFIDCIIQTRDKKSEAIFSGDYTLSYPEFPYHSVISIPMIDSRQIHGFIIVMHEEKSYFTFENFKLMKSLTHHSTLALVNTILRDKLEVAVITDYLTGLYSRNYLDKMFSEHMQKDEKGTLILFDIDDFKKINDTYGHSVGDKVIVSVANIIKKSITTKDIPARWGGEEFAIYLPHDGLIKGVQMAEIIRKKVAEKTDPSVTFSCGVSTWNEQHPDSVSDVFIRADRALYEAKAIGKNRVIIDDQLSGYVNQ